MQRHKIKTAYITLSLCCILTGSEVLDDGSIFSDITGSQGKMVALLINISERRSENHCKEAFAKKQ